MDRIISEDVRKVIVSLGDMATTLGGRALVTGGAGFLGSYVCDTLIQLNMSVACLDDLSSGKVENVDHLMEYKEFTFMREDVSRAVIQGEYDYILHMASPAAPMEYQQRPVETMLANSLGTLNVLEVARRSDAMVLYASTSEVYGDAKVLPTPEGHWGNVNPIGPRSCYDESKRFGEALMIAYAKQYGMDIRIVRIFNTYGPRMRSDGVYGRVVPRFINQALSGKPITVYGRGRQTRSFCYVSDTIEGVLRALVCRLARGEVINIGNPDEVTILELAKIVKKVCRSGSRIAFEGLPEEDPRRRVPDVKKAKRLLGWRPRVRLMEGLVRTVEWFRMKGV